MVTAVIVVLSVSIEYKVGERVITEEGNIKGFNDKVGVIKEIDVTYEYPYLVDIDGHEIWCKVKCLADDKPDNTKWRVVNRKPKEGDYIRLTNKPFSFNSVGEILKVAGYYDGYADVYAQDHPYPTGQTGTYLWHYRDSSYEVVEKVEDWEWEEEIPF